MPEELWTEVRDSVQCQGMFNSRILVCCFLSRMSPLFLIRSWQQGRAERHAATCVALSVRVAREGASERPLEDSGRTVWRALQASRGAMRRRESKEGRDIGTPTADSR